MSDDAHDSAATDVTGMLVDEDLRGAGGLRQGNAGCGDTVHGETGAARGSTPRMALPSPSPRHGPGWPGWAWFVMPICMGCAAAPALMTILPPVVDLPQHLAQVGTWCALASEGLATPSAAGFEVREFGSHTLIYYVIRGVFAVMGPAAAGRWVMALLAITWVAASFAVAWTLRRSVAAAVLTTLAAFNCAFAWGFLNFLVGYPLFAAWFVLMRRRLRVPTAAMLVAVSWGLVWANPIWLAMALLVAPFTSASGEAGDVDEVEGLAGIGHKLDENTGEGRDGVAGTRVGAAGRAGRRGREIVARMGCMMPALVVGLVEHRELVAYRAAAGFNTPPQWTWEGRLAPERLVGTMSQSLPLELTGLVVLAGVALAGVMLWRARRAAHAEGERLRLDVAAMAVVGWSVVVYVLGPSKLANSILLGDRLLALAFILFVLAIPHRGRMSPTLTAASMGCVVTLSTITCWSWRGAEQSALSGLSRAMEQIPSGAKVLGLPFARRSRHLMTPLGMHAVAYAEQRARASTSFSFAEHGSGIVRNRRPGSASGVTGLEWQPERVSLADFARFDHALVSLPDEAHARFESEAPVQAVTHEGVCRLYRITLPGPAATTLVHPGAAPTAPELQ